MSSIKGVHIKNHVKKFKMEKSIKISLKFNGVFSRRANGLRMGKGKGSHDRWVCPVRSGQILYEISGVSHAYARFALRKAADKMPFRCKVVKLIY